MPVSNGRRRGPRMQVQENTNERKVLAFELWSTASAPSEKPAWCTASAISKKKEKKKMTIWNSDQEASRSGQVPGRCCYVIMLYGWPRFFSLERVMLWWLLKEMVGGKNEVKKEKKRLYFLWIVLYNNCVLFFFFFLLYTYHAVVVCLDAREMFKIKMWTRTAGQSDVLTPDRKSVV